MISTEEISKMNQNYITQSALWYANLDGHIYEGHFIGFYKKNIPQTFYLRVLNVRLVMHYIQTPFKPFCI